MTDSIRNKLKGNYKKMGEGTSVKDPIINSQGFGNSSMYKVSGCNEHENGTWNLLC